MSPELLRKPLYYDAQRRRLWIHGQRCHHGATGALLASCGMAGALVARLNATAFAALLATGGALMLHDWQDRALWFARGSQD